MIKTITETTTRSQLQKSNLLGGGRLGDSGDPKIPILLDLVARSSVADFGYLPLVNALVGSLAGATISA
jgi:hypothetical protein